MLEATTESYLPILVYLGQSFWLTLLQTMHDQMTLEYVLYCHYVRNA